MLFIQLALYVLRLDHLPTHLTPPNGELLSTLPSLRGTVNPDALLLQFIERLETELCGWLGLFLLFLLFGRSWAFQGRGQTLFFSLLFLCFHLPRHLPASF